MGMPSLVPLLYLTCVTVHIPVVVLLFGGTPPAKLPADGLSGSFLSPSLSRLIHSINVLKLRLQPGLPCNGYYPLAVFALKELTFLEGGDSKQTSHFRCHRYHEEDKM